MNTSSPQYLKLLGHLPHVDCEDLAKNPQLAIDPALVEVGRDRLCLHPDKPDAEIATADPAKLANQFSLSEDEAMGYIEAHARMRKAGENSGSWPRGCYDSHSPHPHGHNHKGRHATKFYVDIDTFRSRGRHYVETVTQRDLEWVKAAGVWRWSLEEIMDLWSGKPMLDVAIDLMVESYRLIGVSMIQVDDGPNGSEHNIHIKCVAIPGSTIGVAWFNNGTCGDHVNHHIDSGWRPGLAGAAGLLTHEAGHNMNFQHTFSGQGSHRGVMSYNPPSVGGRRQFYGFSTGESPHVLPRDPALRQAEKFFDTREIPLADSPAPPQPPGPQPPGPQPPAGPTIIGTFKDPFTGVDYTISRKTDGGDDPIIW